MVFRLEANFIGPYHSHRASLTLSLYLSFLRNISILTPVSASFANSPLALSRWMPNAILFIFNIVGLRLGFLLELNN
jgi:hypothetical protein